MFLSSTFRDMHEEREELIKRVFPSLRRKCRQRGVDLVEVDLRWGITESQAERGEVLPVCIREIEACQPYFIGILGEYYGTIPQDLPADAPWLLDGASITHMEIHWAALRPEATTDRAFFFFRHNAPGPAPQQILKTHSRHADLPVQEFRDAVDLAQQVEQTLWTAIDQDFPLTEAPSWLDRERSAMQAFARTRAQVYVGRSAWFERLDGPASVIVTGGSGMGKSALLANWSAAQSERTFVHFLGATPQSSSSDRLIHRLLAELGGEAPPDSAEHRAAVLPCLAAAAPVTLVLDAVEHLDEMNWLPHPLPEGVRLVASGLPSPALEDLRRRGIGELELAPLTENERLEIVETALARHGKTLNPDRLKQIVSAPQTATPLYLRTLTEELRVWGDHDKLDEIIDRLLQAEDVPTLFSQVLERLEQDYEREHPGLVAATLGAVAAARRGLTEPELLEVVDVPPLVWAPLHFALESWLMSRDGILTFFHDGLRRAVHARYAATDDELKSYRRTLIDYFGQRPIDDRVAEELLWLQASIDDQAGLIDSLTNIELFLHLQVEAELQDLVKWWRNAETDPVEGYRTALTRYEKAGAETFELAVAKHLVARFLQMLSHLEPSLTLFDEARQLYEASLPSTDPNLGIIANDEGLALFIAGRFKEAEPLFRKALSITGEVAGILHNLAEILLRRSAHEEAEQVARRAVDAYRGALGRHEMTATAMQNLARARMELGDLEGAEATLKEALTMVEGAPSRALALALSNLGGLQLRQGRLKESEATLRRSISISREVLGEAHPHSSATLCALGSTLFFAGREREAEQAYREAVNLIETHLGPEHPNLNTALVALANLHLRRGDAVPARDYAERALKIATNEFGPRSVDAANAIQSLSAASAAEGDLDLAIELAFQAVELHEETLGAKHAATARSFGMIVHLGRTLLENKDPRRAEPLLRATVDRAEQRLGPKHPQLGPDLWNHARALVELGRLTEAIPLLERELAILEAHKGANDEETAASRQNLEAIKAAAQSRRAAPSE
ncbi:MAG: tetratricopeptide repeat protein [Myxococcota bacterium]